MKIIFLREKSHFIAEALKQRIEEIQEEELNKILEEGYKARKKQSLSIAKEFEAVDLEDLKKLYPSLNMMHLLVDTTFDLEEKWVVIGKVTR